MKRMFVRVVFAALLTFPIHILLSRLLWMTHWFENGGEGWNTLAPLFRVLGSAGGEQDENILVGGIMLISFMISLALSLMFFDWMMRRRV